MYQRTISRFHSLSFVYESKSRIKVCFESREKNQVLLLFFFPNFKGNETRKSKNTTRLSIQVCKRETRGSATRQYQDREEERDRVQSINQNKTRSISARVKLDKCSID